MRTAIVYDRVNKWGGAERVLVALHELFPKAPLYTSVYAEKHASWAQVFPKVIPSFLQKIPGAASRHEFLAPLMPLAFESLNFDGYDLVITVTSEAAKGIITKPETLHICYCLTPTRYLWSHYDDYFKSSTLKAISKLAISYLRAWDRIASQRPDVFVAISSEVKKRIKKYYDRDSELIFPPVDTKGFEIQDFRLRQGFGGQVRFKKKDYYLIVSRLVPYKKVDLAVNAFNKLGLPLVIVGTGSEEGKLKSLAKKNIKFAGFVKEGELPGIYRNAKALIYPQNEDFGITAVEAQAAGVPVIAYKAGGTLDTVTDGKTGVFFDKQTGGELASAVENFDELAYKNLKSEDCVRNAKKFSKEKFKNEFISLVKKYVGS